jgi:hypothetical protein
VKFPKNVLEGVNEITAQPQGVWTSLGISWDALTDVEQKVFTMLSIFSEAVNDATIQAVTRMDSATVSKALDVLVRRSLVQRRKNYFAVHRVIRAFGKSKMVEDSAELHRRAADYYFGLFQNTKGFLLSFVLSLTNYHRHRSSTCSAHSPHGPV